MNAQKLVEVMTLFVVLSNPVKFCYKHLPRGGKASRAAEQDQSVAMECPINESLQKHIWTQDHSIEIKATAKAIWPWLAQMGNGRAGWYSYDWLDNLGRKSLEVIDPKFIAIEKGQKIPLATICDFVENQP
jgi:hypothetical protein